MSAFRVVMVAFRQGTQTEDIVLFRTWLEELAACTPGLVQMVCGSTAELGNEGLLADKAPNATYGDFASIWEFENAARLSDFVDSPVHHDIARKQFSTIVEHRYVFNLKLGPDQVQEPGS